MNTLNAKAGVALALMMSAGAALAQESFVVAGPLDVYMDLKSSEQFTGYTWVAEVSYNPSAATMEVYERTNFNQSFFYDSIVMIEYTIYDTDGSEVVSGVEIGHVGNVVSAVDDKNYTDTIYDQVYWYADDPLSTVRTRASIGFSDSTGAMVDAVDFYPDPPEWGQFDFGGGEFYQFDTASGEGFKAWGRIKSMPQEDPIADCRKNARNHGQFISCSVKILNAMRKAGEITGREKGQWISMLAQFEELKGYARRWADARAPQEEGAALEADSNPGPAANAGRKNKSAKNGKGGKSGKGAGK